MKIISVLSVAVMAACGGTSGGGGGGGDTGTITANWSIKSVSNQNLGCPPGYDTAALYSQPIDANYNDAGPVVIDYFNCSAMTATSAPLAPDTYLSWIAIETHDHGSTYASTVSAFVDLTSTDKTFSANIYDDGGYFQMAWQLEQGGSPISCAAAPAVTGIESIATEVNNSSNAASDIFHCTDHYGVTSVLPAGTYTVSIDALNSAMQAIGSAPPITNAVIQPRNQVTNLHTITISLN